MRRCSADGPDRFNGNTQGTTMKLIPDRQDTIGGLRDAIARGETTCEAVTARCLDRIEAEEPRLHAWVQVDREGAIRQARRLDEEHAADQPRGPLHGIPIGIKDIVDVQGLPTLAGFPGWHGKAPAERDAPVVAALRSAGAVILGKTVTTQFASFDPPPTRNPWNVNHTPGGSSSGSAAAVASGMCPAAIGSQTGGSITRPAAFCGVAGCKPTFGTVPVEGIVPFATSLDHPGPIARCVADLATVLAVLQGRAAEDMDLSRPRQKPLRLGRLRGFFDEMIDPEMSAAFDQTLDTLMSSGALVYDVPVPEGIDRMVPRHRLVMATEAATWHRPIFETQRNDYAPCIAQVLGEGMEATAVDYLAAREFQREFSRDMEQRFEGGIDALVSPASLGPAPDTSTTGDPRMNSPWSLTGLPTVSFPMGLSSLGLPLAIQLAGQRHQDAALLNAAAWCERAIQERLAT